jgi:hypothetical protein
MAQYVIIENRIFIAEFFEVKEGVVRAEILELDQELGECSGHLIHKLFHELGHNVAWYALLTQTKIKRVVQELLGVSSKIKTNGDRGIRPNSIQEQDQPVTDTTDAERRTDPAPAT